ncbi:MAG: hypothetical protein WAK93_20885 [Solirubrobacteraceae bacterium]
MYLPLLGGFVALVLLSVLMGWIMDTSRRDREAERKPPVIKPRR